MSADPDIGAPVASPSPIRVLCVTLYSDRAETETFIGLQRSGCEVCVYCMPECPYIERYKSAGIRVVPWPFLKRIDRAAIGRLREEIRTGDYDIVHLLHNRAVSNGLQAVKHFGKPKVIAYRGIVGNVRMLNPASWMRYLHPRVERVICVADAVRRYFLGLGLPGFRLRRDKFVTIYKGHDVSWYCDEPVELGAFDIPPGAFVVGCVANMRPRKGVEVLVEAFGRLPRHLPVYLLLVGNMDSARLDRAIATSPKASQIRKVGYRSDAPAIIAACDISVLPTLRREGLPKTVIEAMVYEVAPIVTDTGGSPELVEDGVSGIVVPPGDAGALAEAMLSLYRDPELRDRLGRAARLRIESDFNIATTIEQTLALYRELLFRGRALTRDRAT
jgi:glycosyltransferase involved in cell wall biosynthesis